MDTFESLSHSVWACKYHLVFIPKGRRKTLYGPLRQHLGEVFRKLATQKESRIEEGHLLPDHVHMMIDRSTRCRRWSGSSREECDSFGPGVRGAQAKLCRAALLGPRVLRIDRRPRRAHHPGSTSGSRKKLTRDWTNWASGDNGPPLRWRQSVGAALATPLKPL